MTETNLPKGYEPQDVESRWRTHWETNNTFAADPDAPGEPYSIVIPPPNVTGSLHMGHALNLTIQDVLCRHMRQLGRNVLWVPGTDHAGIATQNVVERQLATEGKTRDDLGREAFIERVWEWRKEYGGRIIKQIRAMGASVDWTRERFTLDEGLNEAVREVFVRLFKEGLIYKGDYIINWCNRCHTALADDEVEHTPKKGKLYKLRYPLEGGGELVVATTRPETMLGDTAIAVHPEDERYNAHIGKYAVLPLHGRRLIIIGDTYVDKEFGTGCLKVTPAHDMNDWELGRKHGLDLVKVIDEAGNMCGDIPAKYAGMSKEACREAIMADLEAQGFVVAVDDYDHSVGHCYRCKSVIEPHVSTQWFVSVKPLAAKARAAVPDATKIFPEAWTKTYYNWLDDIRDWCVSRQIWWGHRIPAWTCLSCGKLMVETEQPDVCPDCGSTRMEQDPDVLDTWFSSALWPFSTMGWPQKTKELATYYPTSVLLTGFDIIFFWVARMMMMGIHFMGEVPFKDVYIHALVRDADGKKMSKSTGNVIDPLEMIDKYGTDSLRFTLAAFAAMGRDIKLSEERIEGNRHFVNKLWNAARFALMNLPESFPDGVDNYPVETTPGLHHAWLFHRIEELKRTVRESLAAYRFNDAAMALYTFVWREFCDWYLEMIKPEMNAAEGDEAGQVQKARAQICLWRALKDILVMLHPIMPFVTAEIWTYLPGCHDADLALEPYPAAAPERADATLEERMALLQETVVAVRNIRGELNIGPAKELDLIIRPASDLDHGRLLEMGDMIRHLARVGKLDVRPDAAAPKASASAVVRGNECRVPLKGLIDFDAELARLDKELGKADKELLAVEKKLANQGFVAKAPADVVQKEREKADALAEKKTKLAALRDRMAEAAAE
ncbi:MAG: valine--tRNA ligase [Desulfovibrionaceae bacterium]